MGWFYAIIVTTLDVDAEFQKPQVDSKALEFTKAVYVSWESTVKPTNKWAEEGAGTLYITLSPGGKGQIGEVIRELNYVPEAGIHQISPSYWRYRTSLHPYGDTLYHLVLPRLWAPEPTSVPSWLDTGLTGKSDINPVPTFIKKQHDRIALTWIVKEVLELDFKMRSLSLEEFQDYAIEGGALRVCLDLSIQERVEQLVHRWWPVGESFAAKIIAELFRSGSRPL